MELKVPDYVPEMGFEHHWEYGFEISVDAAGEIVIKANKPGLISLAIQLLTLARDSARDGTHFHLDEFNSLAKGSKALVVEKSKKQ